MPDDRRARAGQMSGIGAVGIGAHLLLILWLAPIAFTDDGRLAPDWVETLIPFTFLAAPLLIAGSIRTKNAFLGAGTASLVLGVIFFLGSGILLFIPGILYLCAGIGPQEPRQRRAPCENSLGDER